MSLKYALAFGTALLLASPGVQAAATTQYFFYNLDESSSTTSAVAGAFAPNFGSGPLGQQFTAQVSTNIWDLALSLSAAEGGGSIVVTLNADDGDAPAEVLATLGTLTDNEIATGSNPFSLSGLTASLSAGTSYWIMLTDGFNEQGPQSSVQWDVAVDGSDGVNGTNPGASYTFSDGTPWSPGDPAPFIMSVSVPADEVPEPATIALLGVGLLGLGALNRRRRR